MSSRKHIVSRMSRTNRPEWLPRVNRQQGMSGVALPVILMGSILVCGLVLVFAVKGGRVVSTLSIAAPATLPAGPGSWQHAKGWCGQPGQPTCQIDPHWLAVLSQQPGAIAHIIMKSSDYMMMQSRFGYTALDTPVLIYPLDAHTAVPYYNVEHWVVSARNVSGKRVGLFDFIYDRTGQRIRFASFGVITAQDPHAQSAFPYRTASAVMQYLQKKQTKIHLLARQQPELTFFLLDHRYRDLRSRHYRWSEGGDGPMNPIWHIVGADRHDYFVGSSASVVVAPEILPS